MKLTALSVSVWDADDYLYDRNTKSKDIKADLEGALLGNCDCWKWTNPQHVEFLISHL